MKKFIGLMAILSIVSFAAFGSLTAFAGGRCGEYKGCGGGHCYEKGCKKMCNYGYKGCQKERCGEKKRCCNKGRRCGYAGGYGEGCGSCGSYRGGYYEKGYGRGYYGYEAVGYGSGYYGYENDGYYDNWGYDY